MVDRANAETLFEPIEETVPDLKIASNGKFSTKKPDAREARKLFHLHLNRPFTPRMSFD